MIKSRNADVEAVAVSAVEGKTVYGGNMLVKPLTRISLPPSLRAAADGPLIQATLPPIIPRFRRMQAKIPFEAVVTRQLFWD